MHKIKLASINEILNIKNKKSNKSNKNDFLIKLIETTNIKDIKKTLKNLNVKKEDLKELLKKDLKHETKNKIEEILVLNNIELPQQEFKILINQKKELIKKYPSLEKEINKITSITQLKKFIKQKGLNLEKIKIENIPIEKNMKNKNIVQIENSKTFNNKNKIKNILKEKETNKNFFINKTITNQTNQKLQIENLIKKSFKSHESSTKEKEIINSFQNIETKEEIKKEINEEKTNEIIQINNEFKISLIQAKENIQKLATKLKEAAVNYKPPITKLSIDLNPKELGKLKIEVIKKGDKIEVNINSNPITINLLNNYQNDLKTSLQNLGFNNISMDFNSNKEKQNESNQNHTQKKKYKYEEEEEGLLTIEYTYA